MEMKSMTDPERLDHFMARANAAYYAQRDPFADFTTAPEISQIFGELLGAWAAITWTQLGNPDPVLLIEAGPGRGTLMADAHRTITRVAPAFAQALHIHFIETSPRLRAEQAKRIPNATWHDRLEDIPPGPTILLANEFLDALPIRQFVRQAGLWSERHVAAGTFITLPCAAPPCATLDSDFPDGAILEINEPAQAWTAHLAARLARDTRRRPPHRLRHRRPPLRGHIASPAKRTSRASARRVRHRRPHRPRRFCRSLRRSHRPRRPRLGTGRPRRIPTNPRPARTRCAPLGDPPAPRNDVRHRRAPAVIAGRNGPRSSKSWR